MKVGIDTSPLKSEHKVRGVGMYTKRLVEALEKLKSGEKLSWEEFKILNDTNSTK